MSELRDMIAESVTRLFSEQIDRKVLADIAVRQPATFKALVDQARAALN